MQRPTSSKGLVFSSVISDNGKESYFHWRCARYSSLIRPCTSRILSRPCASFSHPVDSDEIAKEHSHWWTHSTSFTSSVLIPYGTLFHILRQSRASIHFAAIRDSPVSFDLSRDNPIKNGRTCTGRLKPRCVNAHVVNKQRDFGQKKNLFHGQHPQVPASKFASILLGS